MEIFLLQSVILAFVAGSTFGIPENDNVPSTLVSTDFVSHVESEQKKQYEKPAETRSIPLVQQADSGSKVCNSTGCAAAAADIRKSIDETVDPCNDFYQFACGKFIKNAVIPEHDVSYDSFSEVEDELDDRLRNLVGKEHNKKDPKYYANVKNYYQSCMDTESIEEIGVEQANKLMEEELGGWPVVMGDDWSENGLKWHNLAINASDRGLNTGAMMSIGISTDNKNSTKRILVVGEPSLGLSREFLIKGADDKDVKAYFNKMVETACFFGADRKFAKKEMKKVLEFELKIAEMTLPNEETRNVTAFHNTMTIKEASLLYPELPWVDYIEAILSPDRIVTIDEDEIVNVAVPKYLKDFKKFISTISSRTIANYLMWRNAQLMMPYLSSEALDIQHAFIKAILGQSSKTPRWEKCVTETADSFTNAVGAMYANKFARPADNKVIGAMVKEIRQEFNIMLKELDWMDDATREKAIKKANQMTAHIGYPEELLNESLVNEYYTDLHMRKSSYLKNALAVNRWSRNNNAGQFRLPIDKNSWKTHGKIAEVGASYRPTENSINLPAGIFNGAFYHKDRPLYLNYGAIGFVVGHEITHGFDDQGSQRDKDGNLIDWWAKDTKKHYLKKAKCMIEQYGNFSVNVNGEKLNLNGINTQGENIADNGGLKEAHRAYNRVIEKNGPELLLPGLNYTQGQLFWISAARVWCKAMRPAALKYQVLTDPHSPSQFRVNGPLANLAEFSKDWGCPAGCPMNPKKKCQVW